MFLKGLRNGSRNLLLEICGVAGAVAAEDGDGAASDDALFFRLNFFAYPNSGHRCSHLRNGADVAFNVKPHIKSRVSRARKNNIVARILFSVNEISIEHMLHLFRCGDEGINRPIFYAKSAHIRSG